MKKVNIGCLVTVIGLVIIWCFFTIYLIRFGVGYGLSKSIKEHS